MGAIGNIPLRVSGFGGPNARRQAQPIGPPARYPTSVCGDRGEKNMGIAAKVGGVAAQVMCKMPLHVMAGYATFRKQKPRPE